MTRLLRDEGYLDVRVWVKDVSFNDDRDEATILVAVEEGMPWTLGEVQVTGGASLPERDLVVEKSADFVPGMRWRRRDMDRVVTAMENEAKRQGFSDVRIDLEPLPRAEGRVQDLRLVVVEGQRKTIRSMDVSGNTVTRDKVILREFTVAPGDPLDANAIQKSVRRVMDTQYFSSVVPVFRDADAPDRQDVEIRVEENPRTSQFRIGFGVSSNDGLFGAFDLTLRNFDIEDPPGSWGEFFEGRAFKGSGQTLQLTLQPGTTISNYRLAFTEPWLMDQPVLLGVDLYAQNARRFRYDQDRQGVEVTVQRRFLVPRRDLDDLFTVGIRPRVESVEISSVDRDAPPNAFPLDGRHSIHALALDLGWQRVDRSIITERGWSVQSTHELVGEQLGGDFDFHRHSVRAQRVYTLHRDEDDRSQTLTLKGGAGFAGPLGEGPVPLTERFYGGGTGGLGAVRGFDYGGIGAHGRGDPSKFPLAVARSIANNQGDPLGGEAVGTATVEYGIPLYSDVLRGALFLDAGNVAENTGGLRRDWRTSAGFGILIRIPVLGQVPLRFDFGFPLHKERGDDRRVLSFEFSRFF